MSSGPEFGLADVCGHEEIRSKAAVSDDVVDELRKVLEEVAERIARQAVELFVAEGNGP